ncbi:MAG: UDP-N-acetylmuramoyl-L-alanyl-D-glutamate--2,6-diaminopimelate ligase [Candidatus Hydrogenedentota bacterium]|nr:MAG: UDP-N-acetylmuramoyl-L-alanyl-D-glutamate--2,6-diaminopimelate ligase [Candidatus Hydrogenedentota bacterium]
MKISRPLEELLPECGDCSVLNGSLETEIWGISEDSRTIEPGYLFVARRGRCADGLRYIEDAVEAGAAAILCDREPERIPETTLVVARSLSECLPDVCRRFYADPSRRLMLFGVTGTNGKTTTAFLLQRILERAGRKTAVIGTTGFHCGGEVRLLGNTTPGLPLVNALLAEALEQGCEAVVMEVSSHALDQGRVAGLRFRAGVFTNLTQDHLDYHETMEQYFKCKARLFDDPETGGAVNADDPWGRRLLQRRPDLLSFGENGVVRAADVVLRRDGTDLTLCFGQERHSLRTGLVGRVNVQNCLAAAAAARAWGMEPAEIGEGLSGATAPPGRFEIVSRAGDFTVAVDYAHTPDALERLLRTARELEPARVLLVFGCGGDRDRAKRPLMGAAASRLADEIWVTSDNPRTENPEKIIEEITAGMGAAYHVEVERRAAIEKAVRALQPGDLLLIAGKGHETTQEINGVKRPFDDRIVAREALRREKKL